MNNPQDISDATISRIREDYLKKAAADGRTSFGSQYAEYGPVDVVVGTGRARCRACGEKIAKGVTALAWLEDMGGSGSFTATRIQMHAEPCRHEDKTSNPPKLLTLYHVTLEKNVPSIRKHGIRPQKKAMWVGAFGQRLAPKDAIFAFDNFDDAGRWAFKTQYDMGQPAVVLEFKDDSPLWQPDPHWQGGLSKGQWLTRREWAQGYPAVVGPEQIHGIVTLDSKISHALVKTLGEPKQVNKFGKIVAWSRA